MHSAYLNRYNLHKPKTDYDMPYPYKESYLLLWWLKRTSLALISPNRKIKWTRFYQLSGHAKPFH